MYFFSDYNLRPTNPEDREHAAQWIAADPDHAGSVKPEFFVNPDPAEECFLLLDKFGEPVFYFKMERALRIHIQFGPAATKEDRLRTMAGLGAGMGWLEGMCRRAGFKQVIFSSRFKPLIRYCKNKLGFRESQSELLKQVVAVKAAAGAAENHANTAAPSL